MYHDNIDDNAKYKEKTTLLTPSNPPLPEPIPLTELKSQSAIIHCPHCLEYVYTKLNSITPFIQGQLVIATIRPIMTKSYSWNMLLMAACWASHLAHYFFVTNHQCPSCNKHVAQFNKFTKNKLAPIECDDLDESHKKPNLTSSDPPPANFIFLTDLKNQSAFIHCPHCLEYVHTKLSKTIVYQWRLLFFAAFSVILVNTYTTWILCLMLVCACFFPVYLINTVQECSSCHKEIASYNSLKKQISISAPPVTFSFSNSIQSANIHA